MADNKYLNENERDDLLCHIIENCESVTEAVAYIFSQYEFVERKDN